VSIQKVIRQGNFSALLTESSSLVFVKRYAEMVEFYQAIYGWRGADAALMQYALDRDFPEIITFKVWIWRQCLVIIYFNFSRYSV
jgi:hypothetical protein